VAPAISFLTDFGLSDASVGVCKGVLATIAPGVPVLDLGHEVPYFDVERGARMLEYSVAYCPVGSVHVAVVDPGVGTARRALGMRTARSDLLVGPDNGLLIWGAERLGGIVAAVSLENPEYRLHPTSHTFHARDIFCPAAAHLARGVRLGEMGPTVDPAALVRLQRHEPEIKPGEVRAPVTYLSSFGNCHFDVLREHWRAAGLEGVERIRVEGEGSDWVLPYVTTFGDAGAGQAMLLHDSSNRLCLAVNQGDAAAHFGLKRGSLLRFTAAG
jgi:S-adenosylmethionine hydrolase